MEDENIALNSVLGLELNRVFFAVRETANKQKIIEFAREIGWPVVVKPLDASALGAVQEKIGLAGSPTKVVKVFTPPPKGKRELIEGTPDEQAAKVVERV